jgi:hypothetical protein
MKDKQITNDDCIKWKQNKLINPHTNYKINKDKTIYKRFEKACINVNSPILNKKESKKEPKLEAKKEHKLEAKKETKKEPKKEPKKKDNIEIITIDKLISSLNDKINKKKIYLNIEILINNIKIKLDNIEKNNISSKTNTNAIKILLQEINDKLIKLKNTKGKLNKEEILEILILIKEINKKIYYKIYKKKFLNKLKKARKNIKLLKDIYVNKDHEELCEYYKKNNIKSNLLKYNKTLFDNIINKNDKFKNIFNTTTLYEIPINIKYYKYSIKNNSKNKIEKKYKKILYYSNFNLKLLKRFKLNIYQDVIDRFIRQQQDFFNTLNIRELYNLKYYTSIGYEILNNYLKKNFKLNHIDSLYILGNYDDNNESYILFYYQFLDVFYDIYNNKQQDKYQFLKKTNFDFNQISNKEYFINYIKNNFKSFNYEIYEKVFKNYINEMIDIFNKAPIVENDIICYRGIKKNHINENKDLISLKKGIYINNSFMSTSLFIDTAMKFTSNIDKEKRYIQRINIKNNRVIFLQFVSLYEREYEILLPINSRLYIEYPFRKIKIYNPYDKNNSNDIKCEEEMEDYKIMDNILKNQNKIKKY